MTDASALIAGTGTAACAMSDVSATQCTWPAADARRRFLKINFARRMGEICPPAIEFFAAGKADVRPIVADQVGLEEAPGAFADRAADVSVCGKPSSN